MSLTENYIVIQRKNKPCTIVLRLGSLYIMHSPIPSDSHNGFPDGLNKDRSVIFMPVAIYNSDDSSPTYAMCQTMYIDASAGLDMKYEELDSVKITNIKSERDDDEKLILTNKDIYSIFVEKEEKSFKFVAGLTKDVLRIRLDDHLHWYNSAWDIKCLKTQYICPLNQKILDLSLWSLKSLDVWKNFHLRLGAGENIQTRYRRSDRFKAVEETQKQRATKLAGYNIVKDIQKDFTIDVGLSDIDISSDSQPVSMKNIKLNEKLVHLLIDRTNFGSTFKYCFENEVTFIQIINRETIRINGFYHVFSLNQTPEFYTSSYNFPVPMGGILIPEPIDVADVANTIDLAEITSDTPVRPATKVLKKMNRKLLKLHDIRIVTQSAQTQLYDLKRHCKGETL